MANRNYAPSKGSLQRGMVTLHGTWAVGGSGAVTANEVVGKTGMTLARTGTGAYTITFADAFPSIQTCIIEIIANGAANTTGLDAYKQTVSGTGKTATFLTKSANGSFTTADPANGATIMVTVFAKDSSV